MAEEVDLSDDERTLELSTVQAIYPEIEISPEDPFSALLEIPVAPAKPLPVIFPPLAGGAPIRTLPTPPSSHDDHDQETHNDKIQPIAELRYLSYLPSLELQFTLPEGYPAAAGPKVRLTASPSWLPSAKIKELEKIALELWERGGRNAVVFDYIDSLQQAAEFGFDLLSKDGPALDIHQGLEAALLDFDLESKRKKFDQETFECGVCLEPKKGAVCHRLVLCGHVFCIECLQDFYNNCIKEGDIISVKCLTPDCSKEKPAQTVEGRKRRRRKVDRTLDPSELLQIPLEQETVQRYVMLKRKNKLEADKTTIYCPRQWCQGPARSNKTQDADGEEYEDEDEDTNKQESNKKKDTLPPPSERLSICEDCGFAFCSVCNIGWHGEFAQCFPRRQYELTAEEKASEDYLQKHSTPCPTCNTRCQKTMGCNHMICFKCQTHFCYLCTSWLSEDNPYVHYNTEWLPCYQRLWELEGGDEAQEGDGFARPQAAQPAPQPGLAERPAPRAEQANPPPPAPNPPQGGAQPQQARAGPRVNRRVQQGLARPGRPIANHADPENGLQRFLRMAAEDQEDEWDSDELEDSDDELWAALEEAGNHH